MTTSYNNTNSRTPTHIAYSVRNYGEGKSQWTRIGAVWPHRDEQGFSLMLNAMPLDGRIEIRPTEANDAAQ